MKSGAIQNSGCGFEAMKTWAWRTRGAVLSSRNARTATPTAAMRRLAQKVGRLVTLPDACVRRRMSEPQREAGGDAPIGRPVRQPPGHRPRQLQRLEQLVFRPDPQLHRVGLPARDRRVPVDEGKDRQRLQDRIAGPHAPAKGVAQVLAGRRANERVGQADVAEQAIKEALAQIDAQGLVKLPRPEAAAVVRRRELDLDVGGDLGGQGLLRQDNEGPLQQQIAQPVLRSEEHTSELQSLAYLVCRLLLEKKKKK